MQHTVFESIEASCGSSCFSLIPQLVYSVLRWLVLFLHSDEKIVYIDDALRQYIVPPGRHEQPQLCCRCLLYRRRRQLNRVKDNHNCKRLFAYLGPPSVGG